MNAPFKPETPTFHIRDFQAAKSIVEAMIGCTTVGTAGDEEITTWTSPILRAKLEVLLGSEVFAAAYLSTPGDRHMRVMASFLRTLADTIDPPAAPPALIDTPAGKALDEIGQCFGAAVEAGLLKHLTGAADRAARGEYAASNVADIVQRHLMPIEQIIHDTLGSK